jgi:putative two-component system response regulator
MISGPPVKATDAATVLVVDEATESLRALEAYLAGAGHQVVVARDGASALRQLSAHPCDLVLCEMVLPDMDGLDVCRAIKNAPATREIPVIMLGLDGDDVKRERAMQAGADDYAVKPIERAMVLGLVKAQLRIAGLNNRLHELEDVVVSLARAADDRDQGAAGMSERVAHWALSLGTGLGLPEVDLTLLYKAALLHDVGTLGVPAGILAKSGRLDDEEFRQVMEHPVLGERLLQPLPQGDRLLPAVRHHHERVDGTGYPDGLAGDQIPLFARIIAIADAFTAMNADRPYRRRLSGDQAIKTLREGAGTQWDPDLVDRFLQILAEVRVTSAPTKAQAG